MTQDDVNNANSTVGAGSHLVPSEHGARVTGARWRPDRVRADRRTSTYQSRTREARALEGYNNADSRSAGQPLVNLPRTVPVA